MHTFKKLHYFWLISFLVLAFINSCKDDSNDGPSIPVKLMAIAGKSINIDKSGTLWVAADTGVISYLGDSLKSYSKLTNKEIGEINKILCVNNNGVSELWIVTARGLYQATYSNNVINSITEYNVTNTPKLLSNWVTALLVDTAQAKWFATPKGLSLLKNNTWYSRTFSSFSKTPVNTMGVSGEGWVFTGTNGKGVGRYTFDEVDGISGASYYTQEWTRLPSDTILSVYIDKKNGQWYGTPEGIAFHAIWDTKPMETWKSYNVSNGLINNRVQAIAEDKNGLFWFGTAQGVSSLDTSIMQWNNYTTVDGITNPNIIDIKVDSNNTVWFAIDGDVVSFNGIAWKSYFK